jgi:hypothetical protein
VGVCRLPALANGQKAQSSTLTTRRPTGCQPHSRRTAHSMPEYSKVSRSSARRRFCGVSTSSLLVVGADGTGRVAALHVDITTSVVHACLAVPVRQLPATGVASRSEPRETPNVLSTIIAERGLGLQAFGRQIAVDRYDFPGGYTVVWRTARPRTRSRFWRKWRRIRTQSATPWRRKTKTSGSSRKARADPGAPDT